MGHSLKSPFRLHSALWASFRSMSWGLQLSNLGERVKKAPPVLSLTKGRGAVISMVIYDHAHDGDVFIICPVLGFSSNLPGFPSGSRIPLSRPR